MPHEAEETRISRVPRRTPRACKQCRSAKIKCSGSRPCERCSRRHDDCVFPADEPHVAVPERYLRELQSRAAGKQRQPPDQSRRQSTPLSPSSPIEANSGSAVRQTQSLQAPNNSSSREAEPHRIFANAGAEQASRAYHSAGPAVEETLSDPNMPHNPLISRDLSYIIDSVGRPRYLGPTSTWSFCRRALSLLEGHTPPANGTTAPLNLDGTAFRLRWEPKSSVVQSDLKNLPSIDHALYLFNTVKFHLSELFLVVDEAKFLSHFHRFHAEPLQTAQTHRLWFVEYLIILAFGKAFLAPPTSSSNNLPGTDLAALAMSLLPDVAQMHDEQMGPVEVLALLALYFQSIDMRAAAYQTIGQALRLCYVEGIQQHVPINVIDPDFAHHCNSAWWVVYVLDHELAALMGGPPSVPESAITAALPSTWSPSLSAKVLTLRIQLSRLIASICSTVYGTEVSPSDSFIRSTTGVLQQLADLSRELDEIVSSYADQSKGELPRPYRQLTLSYHHCIVLATRPLVMWLLILSVPPTGIDPTRLATPITTLLQTATDSAMIIVLTLKSSAEQGSLETFLPFQLEYVFSAAMLLSIIGTILPNHVPDPSWTHDVNFILNQMHARRNAVAQLRMSELEQLAALLAPLRRDALLHPLPQSSTAHNATDADPGDNIVVGGIDRMDGELTQNNLPDNGFGMPWDSFDINNSFLVNPEQMMELAERFASGDVPPSFLMDPQI